MDRVLCRGRVSNCRDFGFTLYEVLVSIAILAIVGVLAVPQVQKASLKSKISAEQANIVLIQEAKEAYASANPGSPLTSVNDLLPYLPDSQMPQSPFGTEYQNVTSLSQPVASGSPDVPTTDSPNNFVSLAKTSAGSSDPLDQGVVAGSFVALAVPSPTPTVPFEVSPTPTVFVTPTPVPNNNPSVLLTANPLSAYRGDPITLSANAKDIDGDVLFYSFTADGYNYGVNNNDVLTLAFPSLGVKPLSVLVTDGRGGSALSSASVSILNRIPTVSLTNDLAKTYRGNPVIFTATGIDLDGDALGYSFQVNTNSPSVASGNSKLTNSFSSLGFQTVNVTANDGFGGIATNSTTVEITNRPPTLSIEATPLSTYRGGNFLFTAKASDPDNDPLTYTFGVEGVSQPPSQSSTLTKSFSTLGKKSVWAYVSDGFGGQIEKALTVNVTNRPPVASLVANPTSVVPNANVTFTTTASDPDNDPLSYTYTVDGQAVAKSTNSVITRSFATTGQKSVSVLVEDGQGTENAVASVVINVNPLPNGAPSVSLVASPTSGVRGQTFTFTASGNDPDGDSLQYSFNGGAYSSSATYSTSYNTLGNQTVTVKAKDSKGAESAPASVTVSVVNRAPSVSISANPTSGVRGQSFTFTASGSDPDGDSIQYSFNGGAYSSANTFSTSFSTLGTQWVSVNVRDSQGAESGLAWASVSVVNRAPSVWLSANPTSGVRGQTFTFTAGANDPDGDSLQYSFNNGAYSSSNTFTTSYSSLGTQWVSVNVRDSQGAESGLAWASVSVVNRAPWAGLTANPSTVTRGIATRVSLTASGGDPDNDPLSYQFNLPGQVLAASTSNTAQATAASTTTYSVNVGDGNGGVSSASVTVTAVNVAPTVTLTANPTSATTGSNLTFTASGSDANGDPLTYRFNVGGGWTAPSGANTYTTSFVSAGTQTVTVEVNDGQGATAQASASVQINNPPPSNYTLTLQSAEDGGHNNGFGTVTAYISSGPNGPWTAVGSVTSKNWSKAVQKSKMDYFSAGEEGYSHISSASITILAGSYVKVEASDFGGIAHAVWVDETSTVGYSPFTSWNTWGGPDSGGNLWKYNSTINADKANPSFTFQMNRNETTLMVFSTPLLIDLDGDGIPSLLAGPNWKTTRSPSGNLDNYRKFDLDGKGEKMWEWVGPKDGLLVWNDGRKGSPTGKDLFGEITFGKPWVNGFEALKTLDKNNDGTISGSELERLAVWVDANSDAKEQEGEIRSMVDCAITSIALPKSVEAGAEMSSKGVTIRGKKVDIWDWHSALSPSEGLQEVTSLNWTDVPVFNMVLPEGVSKAKIAKKGKITILRDFRGKYFVRTQVETTDKSPGIDYIFPAIVEGGKITWGARTENTTISNMLVRTDEGLGGITMTTEGEGVSWTPTLASGKMPEGF